MLSNLTKAFGGLIAVDNLTMNIRQGTIHGLIGPNGAGKTTVINLITGFYTPTSGDIIFKGQSMSNLKSYERARKGVARTFQVSRLFEELTVMENVLMAMDNKCDYTLFDIVFRGRKVNSIEQDMKEAVMKILQMLGIDAYHKVLAGNLPYGQRRLVEIARALVTEPAFLLLDEPCAGMNPTERNILSNEILKLRDRGLTILVVEHQMEMIMSICDEITVINFGKKIAHGTPKEIQNNQEVIDAYIGGELRC